MNYSTLPRWISCGLCATLLALGAAGDVVRVTLPEADSNALLTTGRMPPDGLRLVLRAAEPPADSEPPELRIVLRPGESTLAIHPPEAPGGDLQAKVHRFPADASRPATGHEVLLKRRGRGWFVYVDDTLWLRFPDRFSGPVAVLHDEALTRRVPVELSFDDPDEETDSDSTETVAELEPLFEDPAYVQRIAPFRIEDDFLVDPEDANAMQMHHWDRRSGTWSIHSVADQLQAEGRAPPRRARRDLSAAHSPNFYCIEAHGPNALMLAGHPFSDRYRVEVAVHGTEGAHGIAFLERPDGSLHAFTATPTPDGEGLRLELWHTPDGTFEARALLAAYDTDLFPGQWHRLGAILDDASIRLTANDVRIGQVETVLPPGGRFGMVSHGETVARFDDFLALSHDDWPIPDGAAWRASWIQTRGQVDALPGPLPVEGLAQGVARRGRPEPGEHSLLTPGGDGAAWAVFGAVREGPHVLATAVRAEGRPFQAALLAGWRAQDEPAVRFVVEQRPDRRIFRLEETLGVHHVTRELSRLELPLKPSREPIQLLLDATGAEGLRAYADGRLVLVDPLRTAVGDAAALVALGSTPVAFGLPLYRSERTEYRNRFEKTDLFVQDPYMRHWASPEGEWIQLPDGRTWFKGDLFGAVAVHLPLIQPSELHLGVGEDQDDGPVRVRAADDRLWLERADDAAEPAYRTVAEIPVAALDWQVQGPRNAASNRWYSVHMEGHQIWIRSGDELLVQHALPTPLAGRRMRIEGLEVEDLGRSRVERTGIVDFLFTESLYAWTLNGGRWEVVNRFQCDPRWSHLNGENAESLAALWSRFEFEGDFHAEVYAGMRHGWYDRAGDLNLTVLGAVDAPSSGYTFVCTGWDPDESQLYSRLFRDGRLLAVTDRYLVPRARENNERRGHNPLLRRGRDVHGAWYYTQLRRAGTQLEVHFDHEPVLRVEDPEPLRVGGLGLWTYRNSMMVARVKMAAESIRPRAIAVRPVPPSKPEPEPGWPGPARALIAEVVERLDLDAAALVPATRNPCCPAQPPGLALPRTPEGIPLVLWPPDAWFAGDPVSQPRFTWRPTDSAPDRFNVTARQAGGSFFIAHDAPPAPLKHIAGWRFEVARSPDAQFNAYYTVGRMNGAGEFQPAQRFFHQIAGSDETRGPFLRSGISEPPAPSPDGFDTATWTPVDLWLPAFPREEDSLWVRFDGFGNLQPSDVQQGLFGNQPDAWYGIQHFAPLLLGAPSLEASTTTDDAGHAAFREAVESRRSSDVHSARLPDAAAPWSAQVHWVNRPDNLELYAAWSDRVHGGIDIRSDIPWPVRRLKQLNATVNNQPAVTMPGVDNRLLVLVPRDLATDTDLLRVELDTSTRRPVGWGLPLANRPGSAPPVLSALESEAFALATFERSRTPPPNSPLASIGRLDPRQGRYLRISNRGTLARLETRLPLATNLATNPLLQFRYRGDPMARVSLQLGQSGGAIAFSETPPHDAVRDIRAHNPGLHPHFHTYLGWTYDQFPNQTLRSNRILHGSHLLVRSQHARDQTGRYSELALDDVVAGPAVGPRRPLQVTPRLWDLDGDGFVEWAILEGSEPYADPAADSGSDPATGPHDDIAWRTAPAGELLEIPLDTLPEGVHHALFRPASPRAHGPVTDIPFLVDRTPIRIEATRQDSAQGAGAGLLLRLHHHGGSPPRFETMRWSCNDEPIQPFEGSVEAEFDTAETRLLVNWPRLLRDAIQQAADGDTLTLRVAGLHDGADNPSDALDMPLTLDFSQDTTPPTVENIQKPDTVFWWLAWTEPTVHTAFRQTTRPQRRLPVGPGRDASALRFRLSAGASQFTELFQRPVWSVRNHPILTFRAGFDEVSPTLAPNAIRLTVRHRGSAGGTRENVLAIGGDNPDLLPRGVSGTLDWSPGGATELTVDLAAWLRSEVGRGTRNHRIQSIQFDFDMPSEAVFRIDQMAILAPQDEDAEWVLQAYDASGIEGLTWLEDGQSEELTLRPAAIPKPAETETNWLPLKVRDRAGNETPAIPIPWLFPQAPDEPNED